MRLDPLVATGIAVDAVVLRKGGGACGANCPFCRGELGLAVVQEEVVRELDRGCFRRGTMEMSEVARCLYEARSDLWAGSERVAVWRDVNRLVLQLGRLVWQLWRRRWRRAGGRAHRVARRDAT